MAANLRSQRSLSQGRGGRSNQRPKRDLPADPAFELFLPLCEGPSGRLHHFKRASDAGRVAGVERRRGDRIERHQGREILGDTRGTHFRADCRVYRRNGRDAVEQGAQVEAGAADQDRQAAFLVQVGNFRLGQFRPVGGRAGIGAVADPVKPMLGTLAGLRQKARPKGSAGRGRFARCRR